VHLKLDCKLCTFYDADHVASVLQHSDDVGSVLQTDETKSLCLCFRQFHRQQSVGLRRREVLLAII